MNPNYPDNGKVSVDDFDAFSRYIKVELVRTDIASAVPETIECFVKDLKAHSYNKYEYGKSSHSEESTLVNKSYVEHLNGDFIIPIFIMLQGCPKQFEFSL